MDWPPNFSHAPRVWPPSYAQLARGLAMLHATFIAAAHALYPESPSAMLIEKAGFPGEVLRIVLLTCLLIGAIDVVINDVMPTRFVARWAARYRWLVLAMLAIVFFGLSFVAAKSAEWPLCAMHAAVTVLVTMLAVREALGGERVAVA